MARMQRDSPVPRILLCRHSGRIGVCRLDQRHLGAMLATDARAPARAFQIGRPAAYGKMRSIRFHMIGRAPIFITMPRRLAEGRADAEGLASFSNTEKMRRRKRRRELATPMGQACRVAPAEQVGSSTLA